jgi:hypothetical protein
MSAQFSKLKISEILSEVTFYTVEKIIGNEVYVRPDNADITITMDDKYVNSMLTSGSQYDKEEKITRTELAEKFSGAVNVAFEVCFYKKVKEADVVKEIMDTYTNSTPKDLEKNLKKAVNKGMEGEQRILRGYHKSGKDEFGRIICTDMEIAKDPRSPIDSRVRLVDPRTIEYLIVRGVKWVAK